MNSLEIPIKHSREYKLRRFANWFPLGLTYAFLYMGRYNLTVAKNALGDLMTKEDFGFIFGIGTVVYAVAFLLNGPLTDSIGGKRAILTSAFGSGLMNLLIGLFIRNMIVNPGSFNVSMVLIMTILYSINMYFQSFGAVAIVKINAHWFHVRERGGFSGIFGTMISSGLFFAFTLNGWFLNMTQDWGPHGTQASWWVFFFPSIILFIMFIIELFLLKDRPGQVGFEDFDTGDASSGEKGTVPIFDILKRIITNPIILTIALIEFCTGVLRNGVMHWFPIYAKEIWVLPPYHTLRDGSWGHWYIIIGMFLIATILFVIGARLHGKQKAYLIISGAIIALVPFFHGGWGGLLFIAGVAGGNIAGWVSDLFFQSRRAPAAGGLYLILAVCAIGMIFGLGGTKNKIGWVDNTKVPFQIGDEIIEIAGVTKINNWSVISKAVACIPSHCQGEGIQWDTKRCMCTAEPEETSNNIQYSLGTIPVKILRNGHQMEYNLRDWKETARAGDTRNLAAGPELTFTPFLLGFFVFMISLCVIGTHGLLSGTATMDFGGSKGAATAVGMIDGFVYLGTAVQSFCLGYLTTRNWIYWPIFLLPFAIIGFFLLLKIWNAKPQSKKQ